jgi:hypothetical protein
MNNNTTIADYGDFMLPRTWTNHYKAISRANLLYQLSMNYSEAEYPQRKQDKNYVFEAHLAFYVETII